MNVDHLNYNVCPTCRGRPLAVMPSKCSPDGKVIEGTIECPACAARFNVTRGIPRFAGSSNYADSFGFQWNTHALTQLDSHSGLPVSAERLFGVSGWSRDLPGQRVLEAGSGAGRFTEVLVGTGAQVVSFDYSSAVDANYANNGHASNLYLFQGDLFNIPLIDSFFDKVVCLGVLQHTPDPQRAFRSLTRYVKPGGQLAIDIYARSVAALMHWKYVLRPITTRMDQRTLYRLVERTAPALVPATAALRRGLGRVGARLMPILEYSHLGLSDELNRQWAVLDTFDMYSPVHDHPKTSAEVASWFHDAGFTDVHVGRGPNGVIGRGVRPQRR
jgi:SAM-dependent methyltransferase/uncharacterized protein YbaR (Trm112 family)